MAKVDLHLFGVETTVILLCSDEQSWYSVGFTCDFLSQLQSDYKKQTLALNSGLVFQLCAMS